VEEDEEEDAEDPDALEVEEGIASAVTPVPLAQFGRVGASFEIWISIHWEGGSHD
jgi:hypothetical protein